MRRAESSFRRQIRSEKRLGGRCENHFTALDRPSGTPADFPANFRPQKIFFPPALMSSDVEYRDRLLETRPSKCHLWSDCPQSLGKDPGSLRTTHNEISAASPQTDVPQMFIRLEFRLTEFRPESFASDGDDDRRSPRTFRPVNLIRPPAASAAFGSQQQPRVISFASTCQFVLAGSSVHASGLMPADNLKAECNALLNRIAECRVGNRPG